MKTNSSSTTIIGEGSSNFELNSSASRLGSICWLNMIASGSSEPPSASKDKSELPDNGNLKMASEVGSETESVDPNNCCTKWVQKLVTVLKWVFNDFRMRHLVWIKFIFFFQSASMTVLYPYLNLHMKSLGLEVSEVAVINAIIPILFIFTPPLAGFMAQKSGNFRILLSVLTALGGIFALLLLAIPPAKNQAPYPAHLHWGISCGRPTNRARYQKLMLHGFRRDDCHLLEQQSLHLDNITFTPGTCGYLCPTRSQLSNIRPKFAEYKVIWPNRGGGFGLAEIVDVVTLDTPEAREYHEPDVVDNNIFFPMNWTFHLSCDRRQTNDCIFNPIRRAPPLGEEYRIQLKRVTSPFRSPNVGPSFDILSITTPEVPLPVTTPINCGAKVSSLDYLSTYKHAKRVLLNASFSNVNELQLKILYDEK